VVLHHKQVESWLFLNFDFKPACPWGKNIQTKKTPKIPSKEPKSVLLSF